MEILEKVKTFFILHFNIIIISLFIIIGLSIIIINSNKKEEVIIESEVLETNEEKIEEILPKRIKVDVKGSVKKEGVYEMSEGSRVIDVLNKAVLLKTANTKYINLSKYIFDEMVIYIFSNSEIKEIEKNKENPCSNITNNACINIDNKSIIKDTANDKPVYNLNENSIEGNTNIVININTATINELQTLPGIGESKASSIVEYRNENGNFNSIEDIKKVSGIGDSVYEKIKNYITT